LDRKLALLELEGSAGAVVVPGRTLGHHYSQQQLV